MVKKRNITPGWNDDDENGDNFIMHDCPYEDYIQFALDTKCQKCSTEASDFLKLAVETRAVNTISTYFDINLIEAEVNLKNTILKAYIKQKKEKNE